MTYDSVTMAKFIVAKTIQSGYTINITKLQKLLFIAYGVSLVAYGERLVSEQPQAWPYGPVFPTTRERLMGCSLESITLDNEELSEVKKDSNVNDLLEFVLKHFGSCTATMLVEWTHEEGSPWKNTTKLPNFNWGDTISDDYIRGYFDAILIRKQS